MFVCDWRRVAASLAAVLLTATALAAQPSGEKLTGQAEEGEYLFRQKCSACHAVGGGDRPTGPDLAGVSERRDRQWLASFIQNPEQLFQAKDPLATQLLQQYNNLKMPAFGLEPAQVEALIVHLAHLEEATHHPAPEPAPIPAGDAAQGSQLYSGERPFANGGAPCLGCHGISGFGLASGANYGPDLTSLYEDFGDEGLVDILKTLPFPSMEPIYQTRPLTDTEQADLRAFFAKVQGAPVASNQLLLVEALSAVLIFMVIIALLGRKRLRGVRRALIARAAAKKEVSA